MSNKTLLLFLVLASVVSAQRPVDSRNNYARIITVVPMVGSGTYADPRRPQYAPPALSATRTRNGIIGYSYQLSDDGQFALVQFVALDRSAFQAILTDKQVKSFEKGKSKKEDLEKELKKYKKDFDLAKFPEVVVP